MSNSKKRQAEDELPAKKPKKSKKKGSKHQVVDETLDTELGVNTLFSRMDNQLLADYLAQKMTRFGSDLSTVELSDLTISGKFSLLTFTVIQPSCSKTRLLILLLSLSSRPHQKHKLVAGGQNSRQTPLVPGEVRRQA